MKLRHCFIDEKGNIWKDTTLIEAAKGLEARPFNVSEISLDEVIHWSLINIRDYIVHYKRVQDADCSFPIILRSDGYLMDGYHRIIKAKITGETLTAKQFVKNPEPDIINND